MGGFLGSLTCCCDAMHGIMLVGLMFGFVLYLGSQESVSELVNFAVVQ